MKLKPISPETLVISLIFISSFLTFWHQPKQEFDHLLNDSSLVDLHYLQLFIVIFSASMGCGLSKFDSEVLGPTCKFQPVRRIEETAQHRRSQSPITGCAISTKELLRDGGDEEFDFWANHGRKSFSSPVGKIWFVKEGGMEEENVKLVDFDESVERKKVTMTAMAVEKDEKEAVVVMDSADDDKSKEDGKSYEGEGRYSEREDSITHLGSPSFREYCIADCDSGDSSNDGGNGDEAEWKNKPTHSNKESRTPLAKKGREGSRFTRVLPKGGRRGVKNLLNITTRYNPAYSTSDDNPRNLAGGAAK